MFCRYCGNLMDNNAAFCRHCGARSAAVPVRPLPSVREQEYVDVKEYWSKLHILKKMAFVFSAGFIAAWTALLVLALCFPQIMF